MSDIFIKSIRINSVRHLKDIEIYLGLQKTHLILTGVNGSGKTSLLEEIRNYIKLGFDDRRILDNHHEAILDINDKKQKYADELIKYNYSKEYSSRETQEKELRKLKAMAKKIEKESEGISPFLNIELEFNVERNDKSLILDQYESGDLVFTFFEDVRDIRNITLREGDAIVKEVIIPDKKKITERYSNDFHNYLIKRKLDEIIFINKGLNEKAKEISDWFEKIESGFKKIFNDESLKLEFDDEDYVFRFSQANRNPVNFKQLSAGISAIMRILSELIMRMGGISRAYEVQGFAFIDEIETHLHPELEKIILPFLADFFPKIQLIVSTHSPIIASSLENAILFDLETGQMIKDAYFIGYEVLIKEHFNTRRENVNKIKESLNEFIILTKENHQENRSEIVSLFLKLEKATPLMSNEDYLKFSEARKVLQIL